MQYKFIRKTNRLISSVGILLTFLFISSTAWSAYTYSDLYVPANLYTTATATGTKLGFIQDSSDNVLWTLAPGESLKLEVIVPAGVSSFTANVQMNTWFAPGGGTFLYGHSYSNDASPTGLITSTGYSGKFVGAGGTEAGPTVAEKRGYLFFHNNTSSYNMMVTSFSISFTVSNLATYNDWYDVKVLGNLNNEYVAQGNINGGAGGSSSSTSSTTSSTSSTSSSTSSTSSTSSSSSGGVNCGGLLGPCTDTSSSSSSSTSSSTSSSGDSSSGGSSGGSALSSENGVKFQNGMAAIGFVGGIYTEDTDYVHWDLGNSFDFGDGAGTVPTRMRFRINIKDLNAFINAGKSFDVFAQQDGLDPVNGYKFWTVNASGDTGTPLFLYPDVSNEAAIEAKLMEFSNVIFARMSTHGELYVVTDDHILHRGILNHHMTALANGETAAAAGTVKFDLVNDLNGDGFNDYCITYDDGYKQYLYYKRDIN